MERQALPLIPVPFRLVVRQVRTEEGYVTDPVATRQLEVLRGLLENADGLVIATDAGRGGELVSRDLLDYLGYRKPALRLWISSLTEKAILDGFKNLREDSDFDNLALAAKVRREADWILGVNASIALGIAAGMGNHSLGRVQTPTLALVCRRYLENRDFVPVSCFHLQTGVCKDGQKVLFTCPLRYERKEDAEKARAGLEDENRCTVLAVEKKEIVEQPPLPHDLTGLQREANTRLGMTAGQTLAVVQRLYERGCVSYPRTGCRHIPEDIFKQAPTLVATLKGHPRFGRHAERLLEKGLNPHAVDESSVAGHHALLITGEMPEGLSPDEQNIYSLIAGRMLEAFSEGCVREVIRVKADYGGMEFEAETSRVKYPGWRDIYNGPDMAEEGKSLLQFHRGETLAVLETEILEDSTKPLPPFTEAGLLAAMENAGGTADGESNKKTTERYGLGTPGTRAGIIDLLVARRYVERIGNRLIPTKKGLEIYGIVGDKLIADAAMTAAWEEALREIEEGRLSAGKFMKGVHEYARKIVSELLALQVGNPGVTRCACPKCGTGTVALYDRVAKCGDPDCAFHLPRMFNGREMTDEEMTRLMVWEATPFLKFTTKAGKPYEASLRMDENYKVELTFKNDGKREL